MIDQARCGKRKRSLVAGAGAASLKKRVGNRLGTRPGELKRAGSTELLRRERGGVAWGENEGCAYRGRAGSVRPPPGAISAATTSGTGSVHGCVLSVYGQCGAGWWCVRGGFACWLVSVPTYPLRAPTSAQPVFRGARGPAGITGTALFRAIIAAPQVLP